MLRGIARRQASEGRTPRQAAALTAEALAAIRATAHRPRTGPGGRTESAERARRRGDMDIAIVTVMRDAMLRRSEAAALIWDDVECLPDCTGRLTMAAFFVGGRSQRGQELGRRLAEELLACLSHRWDLIAGAVSLLPRWLLGRQEPP